MRAKLDFFCRYSLSSFAPRQITWVYRQRILKVANFTEIKTVLQIFVNLIDRKTFLIPLLNCLLFSSYYEKLQHDFSDLCFRKLEKLMQSLHLV